MEDIVIALASRAFVNGDVPANLATMLDTMAEAAALGAELVCFGEAFLQGFDSLCWDYAIDRAMALTWDSGPIRRIREASRSLGVDVLFGFIEREGEALYSSCMLVERGEIACRYRRMSRGWKDCRRAGGHYREGREPAGFTYRGWRCAVALCGDLWDDTQDRFRLGEDILFWPVYCGYTPEAW
ncbi:MAG: nitrilase-related carbon-nitrogen hydrolase, partial [Aristaeellaceae bacterium]